MPPATVPVARAGALWRGPAEFRRKEERTMLRCFGRITLATLAAVPILGSGGRPASPAPTEIVVVGTVHAATEKYSAQDLVRILQKVKPDVILFVYSADTAINDKQWLMNQGIPEIMRLTPGLRGCEAFWNESRAYWVLRNNEMLRNIRRLAMEFAGKRLVVLCGYEHRYYLRSHLYDWDEQPGYVVKEYWEY
jgi:hypothetical protein